MNKLLFVVTLVLSLSSFAQALPLRIDHRIQLSGSEGWDCLLVDSSTDRLFVTRGNHVDVIDLKTEKVIGKISDHIDGAHGIAFVPSLNKGYITSGKSAKVVVFDLASLKILKEIPVGRKADIIIYDKFTSRIFAFNADDNSATVIDSKTDAVLKTIKLDGNPEFAVSDDMGTIYVNNEEKKSVIVIDSKEMSVKKLWPLVGCDSPTGLSADFTSHRLFSVCSNEVMAIIDTESGKTIKTLPIGKKPDGSVFDDGLIFSSNGSGTLTIANENSNSEKIEVLQNLETQIGARTMTIDSKTHTAYLVAAKYEAVDSKTPNTRPKIISGTVEILVVKK
jgi:YVTN family beta-propeller protein